MKICETHFLKESNRVKNTSLHFLLSLLFEIVGLSNLYDKKFKEKRNQILHFGCVHNLCQLVTFNQQRLPTPFLQNHLWQFYHHFALLSLPMTFSADIIWTRLNKMRFISHSESLGLCTKRHSKEELRTGFWCDDIILIKYAICFFQVLWKFGNLLQKVADN